MDFEAGVSPPIFLNDLEAVSVEVQSHTPPQLMYPPQHIESVQPWLPFMDCGRCFEYLAQHCIPGNACCIVGMLHGISTKGANEVHLV